MKAVKLRQGGKNPHNLYWQSGHEASKSDMWVGCCGSKAMAELLVNIVNGGVVPAKVFTFGTVQAVLGQDLGPCPVSWSSVHPDDDEFVNIRHNPEAILLMNKLPAGVEADGTPRPEGELKVEDDEVVEEGFINPEPLVDTESPVTEDTSPRNVELGVDAQDVAESQTDDVVVEEESEDPKDLVADDFVIEAIAETTDRLKELTDWVEGKLGMLLFDPATLGDYVSFGEAVEIADGAETRYAASTRSE